jgi:hypothetical protein
MEMLVMTVLAGWVNSPIAPLSPAVLLTVTPEACPTPLPKTTLVVKAPVELLLSTDWNPFSDRTGPEKVVLAISFSCLG